MSWLVGKARRVVLGISGGVDSAVTAHLLKKKGFEVIGLFMRNWDTKEETGHCSTDDEANDAEWICNKLHIPFKQVQFVEQYWNKVFVPLMDGYENGNTPVPDILCNKYIKFDSFLHEAKELYGTNVIATGHYARTSFGGFLQYYEPGKKVRLLQAVDRCRCQTFFLGQVSQRSLQTTMFPIGDLTKEDVRSIAESAELIRVSQKQSSKGICFIGKRNFQDFISQYIVDRPGKIIDLDTGTQLGTHTGIHKWTIGQHWKNRGQFHKHFVVERCFKSGDVYVVPFNNHPALYTTEIFTEPMHWIHSQPIQLDTDGQLECKYRTQQSQEIQQCIVVPSNSDISNEQPALNEMKIILTEPRRAVTPGQYTILYKGDECIGSARIIGTGPTLYSLNVNNCRDRSKELQEQKLSYVNDRRNIKLPLNKTEIDFYNHELSDLYKETLDHVIL